jgi:ATP-dependent RNA helicase RhlE
MRALVLTPTRELAIQVAGSFEAYGKHLPVRCTQVFGGVGEGPQIQAMRRGTDVLVATPGRLLDLHQQGFIDFGAVECFILDEADRMLDMGFIHDIRKVVAKLPRRRQSLFFSATISGEIAELAGSILTEPVEIRIAPKETTAEKIDHRICFVRREDKGELLRSLLDDQRELDGRNLTLVFSRTKHGADRIVRGLGRGGVRAEAIHGNKSQNARQRALENFRRGKSSVLVATDVAARGIDVKGITLVINYDIPVEPEAYVHRIGRTARAGAEGRALSFCTSEELGDLRAIEKLIKKPITAHNEHAFHHAPLADKHASGAAGEGNGQRSGKGGGKPARGQGGGRSRPRGKQSGKPSGGGQGAGKSGGGKPAKRPFRGNANGGANQPNRFNQRRGRKRTAGAST